MPNIQTSVIASNRDGLMLSVLTALPDTEPRALIQIAHGMCEHKERFLPFVRFLAAQGFAVVINDHRGHGASVRSAEDLGYFYEAGANGLVEDLHQITLSFKARFPSRKCILFGHSMGSLAVRAYCNRYDRDIDGLIVCGSPGYNPAAGFGIALTKMLSVLPEGERRRSPLVTSMAMGSFSRRFPNEPKSAWLSSIPENVQSYDNDPLCGFTFTLNGYRALFTLMRDAYDPHARCAHDIPVHFISGADDPCAPDEKGLNDAVRRFAARGYSRVTSKMYTGLRHELLNEKDAPLVMNDLAALIRKWVE